MMFSHLKKNSLNNCVYCGIIITTKALSKMNMSGKSLEMCYLCTVKKLMMKTGSNLVQLRSQCIYKKW